MTPLATRAQYVERAGEPVPAVADRLDALLAKASRLVRAECARHGKEIDDDIAAGDIDGELVADIVCQMVEEAGQSQAALGVSSLQQTAGPFSLAATYANPAGRLYLGKDARRLLGLGGVAGFAITLGDRE